MFERSMVLMPCIPIVSTMELGQWCVVCNIDMLGASCAMLGASCRWSYNTLRTTPSRPIAMRICIRRLSPMDTVIPSIVRAKSDGIFKARRFLWSSHMWLPSTVCSKESANALAKCLLWLIWPNSPGNIPSKVWTQPSKSVSVAPAANIFATIVPTRSAANMFFVPSGMVWMLGRGLICGCADADQHARTNAVVSFPKCCSIAGAGAAAASDAGDVPKATEATVVEAAVVETPAE